MIEAFGGWKTENRKYVSVLLGHEPARVGNGKKLQVLFPYMNRLHHSLGSPARWLAKTSALRSYHMIYGRHVSWEINTVTESLW